MLKSFDSLFERRIVVAVTLLGAILVGLWLFNSFGKGQAVKPRPTLLLISSIALQWGEVDITEIAKGKARPSPLFGRLEQSNKLILLDDFGKLGKPSEIPLLLIQPRALAPAEMVQLDDWVREGGSVIIFADPALDWPSNLPLGDQRRPLFTSLLTPMFRHWGLELALPVGEDGDASDIGAGEYRLAPKSAGIWLAANNPKTSAKCRIRQDEFMAFCAVGKGRALLVADADLLQPDQWTNGVIAGGTMAWLDAVIAAMRGRESFPGILWESQGK
jgi:hypothetical protein